MAIILKANKVNLFVSSVLFVFWYHSPNFLDTPRINIDVEMIRRFVLWEVGEYGTSIEDRKVQLRFMTCDKSLLLTSVAWCL
jgi:hypothetical protein